VADNQETGAVLDDRADGSKAHPEEKLTIQVKLGPNEERSFELRSGSRAGDVLEIMAREHGLRVEELLLFREGDDEPVETELVIDADYPCNCRHYVHHKNEIEVVAFYQSKTHRHAFRRHQTVGHVLIWAIKVFGVDPTMASEFDLTLHGGKDALPESEHIGHLAHHHKCLELDLVRGDIANGGSDVR
jgi:hypothetical protein